VSRSRVGLGFDAHTFEPDHRLIIGGVTVPDSPGLAGHSDADVLCHAITDALLGAARLGDLGALYPDTPQWRGASSRVILTDAVERALEAGWRVVNVDATLIAERPRLTPHRDAMVRNVAEAIGVAADCVSVKATTTDGMGFIGRAEGIAAAAVVLLQGADD
jgi:2-C-methyl-D-erythritol 2,4-cyclodiphosphate synthase